MAAQYRLVVEKPANATKGEQTLEWDSGSGVVMSIRVDLTSDKRRVSTLSAQIADRGWAFFGLLPDPSFQDVPVKLYLARGPGQTQHLVFDGKMTKLTAGYPGPQSTTIIATDRSIDARQVAKARTFKGKTSIQVAKAIADDYGYTVDESAVDLVFLQNIKTRMISFGMRLSDWDHIRRDLDADGLECYVRGSTLAVRVKAPTLYPTTFTKGRPPIVSLTCDINHVGRPGGAGDQVVVLADQNTIKVIPATNKDIRAKQGATATSSRFPATGPATDTTGAHTEDRATQPKERASYLMRKKDTFQMTCSALPDLTLAHSVKFDGFGGKIDGVWYPHAIGHVIASGSDAALTTVSGMRGPAGGVARQEGVVAFS